MSRSYKKHPINTDYSRNITKWQKRMANKAARRYKYYLPSKGRLYRRVYNPWFIHDWIEYQTEMDAREWFRHNQIYINRFSPNENLDEDTYINKIYKKYMVRK